MKDVLIVGAGPVGLTMAISCQTMGLQFDIIDRLPKPSGYTKALALWSSALEMLDGLGVCDEFLSKAISCKGTTISRGRKQLIHIPAGFCVDSPYPRILLLPQLETESILCRALEAQGSCIERHKELINLKQDRDSVSVQVQEASGEVRSESFRWVVACDGAHSTVRHLVGAEFEGEALEDVFVLCDARIEGEIEEGVAQFFWSQEGLLAIFPVTPGVWRLTANRTDSSEDEPTLEEIQTLLDARGPGGWKLHSPTWLSKYHISERKARSFRHGRVFLAGDAAHIHSPAGGQGMNTGMQDAFNLAWKLAVLARGFGNEEAFAESYHSERSPVAEEVLRESGRLIRSNLSGHPVLQFVRDRIVGLASHSDKLKRKMSRQLSGIDIHYNRGPLVAGDEHWAEHCRTHGFPGGWRPRDATVYRDREPVSLFKQWRPCGFTLLLFSGCNPISHDVERLWEVAEITKEWGDLIRIVRIWKGDCPPNSSWFGDPQGIAHKRFGAEVASFYLIRPDQYVALRNQPAEAAVLKDWLSRSLGR